MWLVSDLLGRDALGLQKRGDGAPAVAALGVRTGHVHQREQRAVRGGPGPFDVTDPLPAGATSRVQRSFHGSHSHDRLAFLVRTGRTGLTDRRGVTALGRRAGRTR